jgi:hypothetical protein
LLLFTLAEISPFICDTYEKWGVSPLPPPWLPVSLESATIRMAVAAVLSSFLVLTAWRSSLSMFLSFSEFPYGL